MKEKRILAMFIISAVTLVASLAITFGIFSTLADRAVATGLTRYEFNFNGENNSLVQTTDNGLSIATPLTYMPSGNTTWVNNSEKPEEDILFFEEGYDGTISWPEESVSSRVMVLPMKLTNNYTDPLELNLKITYGAGSDETLARYTFIKIYDFADGTYTDYDTSFNINLAANAGSHEYAIVIFSNDIDNIDGTGVNWNKVLLSVNVEFEILSANV